MLLKIYLKKKKKTNFIESKKMEIGIKLEINLKEKYEIGFIITLKKKKYIFYF